MIEKIHKEGFHTRNDLNYFLTEMKEQESWLYSYHSKMLQMVSTQINGAQKALVELNIKGHKTGRLRFAKYREYRTFTYSQSGFKIESGFLHLSKIGKTKIVQHRPIPENCTVKQITVTKSKSGKWHACVTCDVKHGMVPAIDFKKAVGIDVGIKNFVYDSDGHTTSNPENLQKMLKPLARIQRKISRRVKGSNNRKKALKYYQIIHERIANRRKDFQHKLSTIYAKKYDVVFVEKLEMSNMVKNHRLSRSIIDASWGTFLQKLEYKCNMLVKVPARNTTIGCSRCQSKVPKTLAVRIHKCNACNLILDRDHNASINILKKGLETVNLSNVTENKLPQELREVTPAEISMRSMKQEARML